MALKFITELGEKEFDGVSDITTSANIIFQTFSSEEGFNVDFEFPFSISKKYTYPNHSRVFVLKNKIFRSNDIFECRIETENTRRYDKKPSNGLIGCIFSLEVLFDEDTLENAPKFFNIYAYTAIERILNNEKVSLEPRPLSRNYSEPETFRDLYDNLDITFLVINEDLLQEGFSFQIENYLCDLYKYGFYLADKHKLSALKWDSNTSSVIQENYDNAISNHKVIPIKQSSTLIDFSNDHLYFHTCLYKHIFLKYDALTHFIVLYQVIEILKEKVLDYKIKEILAHTPNYSGHQLRDEINKLKDGELIRILLSKNFSNINPNFCDLLKGKMLSLLNLIKPPDTLAKTIYKLRNTLLHNYSAFPQNQNTEDRIREINQYFEYFIIELMKTYKEPPNSSITI